MICSRVWLNSLATIYSGVTNLMTKRNILKVPQRIIDRIKTFDQDDVVVACAKLLRPEDVPKYSGLGLQMEQGNLITPRPAVPNSAAGRYSLANVVGYEKVRKDLPKIDKDFSFYAPNWGDSSKGMHLVPVTREVYQ